MSIRIRGSAVAALVALAGAGCAAVPTGGRVESAQAQQAAVPQQGQPYVRAIPVRPDQHWSPEQVVRGYLTAAGSFSDPSVAKLYFAATPPDNESQVLVTANTPVASHSIKNADGTTSVTVTAERVGTIDPDGEYQQNNPATPLTETFQLKATDKGWRISQLPPELTNAILLSQEDVERVFRTRNLYFFAPDGKVLVPNPVYLPITSPADLPTQVVQALIKGPSASLSGAVVNDIPAGTRLLGGRVIVSADGTATVNLSSAAAVGNVDGISAQLSLAFQELDQNIRRLRLEIDGETRQPAAVAGPIQTITDWDDVGPESPLEFYSGDRVPPVYVQDAKGHLATYDPTTRGAPQPVASLAAERVNEPAISLDLAHAAWLADDARGLYVGNLAGAGDVREILTATGSRTFTQPSWDRHGNLWVVESGQSGSMLWLVAPGHSPVKVDVWGDTSSRVTAFRVALDGVRVAAIAKDSDGHSQVQVGRIFHDAKTGQLLVDNLLPVSTGTFQTATGLSWRSGDDLSVLAAEEGDLQPVPYDVPVSGGVPTRIGISPPADGVAIAGAPYQAVIVIAAQDMEGKTLSLCSLKDSTSGDTSSEWSCVADLGGQPVYPG